MSLTVSSTATAHLPVDVAPSKAAVSKAAGPLRPTAAAAPPPARRIVGPTGRRAEPVDGQIQGGFVTRHARQHTERPWPANHGGREDSRPARVPAARIRRLSRGRGGAGSDARPRSRHWHDQYHGLRCRRGAQGAVTAKHPLARPGQQSHDPEPAGGQHDRRTRRHIRVEKINNPNTDVPRPAPPRR